MPSVSGLPATSYFSDSIHEGPPVICLGCMLYANLIKSLTDVAVVFSIPLWFNSNENRPSGLAGLIVDTSRSAVAAITLGGGGGSGIVHAVSGVARTRSRGIGAP